MNANEMFDNREDAGKKLAKALVKYKKQQPLILAIPRGGVEVGYQVAQILHAPFSILVARKLPFPDNPEAGFGAIAEDGSIYLDENAVWWLPKETQEEIIQEQKKEINRRLQMLRNGKTLPEIKNRTVILIDDGIAMGSTMRAAVSLCKKKQAKRIVVAVPVAGEATSVEFEKLVDDAVILVKPVFFQAVAQVYRHWHDVSDKEVLNILKNVNSEILTYI
jgi:putative phosphoribosyl transferase